MTFWEIIPIVVFYFMGLFGAYRVGIFGDEAILIALASCFFGTLAVMWVVYR